LRFEYNPDTDSLYIELNPHRAKSWEATQGRRYTRGGWLGGSRHIVIDVDGDGVPVDIDSLASEIVDLTKLESEGPIFGLARAGGPERRVG
jgi:hypothetical protein